MMNFRLRIPFPLREGQPDAVAKIVHGVQKGWRDQTLLGVTGSGKTYVMSAVFEQLNLPTLVISPNKTLAAQLYEEFRDFFPENSVHYFVSYYDYYQPEAYIPQTDTYIKKETDINEEIDRLRHAATQSLLTRRDVIIVASVSCLYGLGAPAEYRKECVTLRRGDLIQRKAFLIQLNHLQYDRNDQDFHRGTYRIRGDVIEIFPVFSEHEAIRIQVLGETVEQIQEIDTLTGASIRDLSDAVLFPATHYLAPSNRLSTVLEEIRRDLKTQVEKFHREGKLLEAERLEQRTHYDLEMIEETGYTSGIENYSRYFDGRRSGDPSFTLLDYFPKEFLIFIDESHLTIPQIRGMYEGDCARKRNLVDYGFRLPAAFDNRPLRFDEFDQKIHQVTYVSATPGLYERERSRQIVELLVRPTGLLDPTVEVRPTRGQIDDFIGEIRKRIRKKQRVLVTTLTKRMAEELSEYLRETGISVHYLHSELDTFKRLEILRDLRLGVYDVVVGINLLREGLDLPEVSLVVILDADKEGYLRNETSFIQVMGRAARHAEGHIIMYADTMTSSMRRAIEETKRRRKIQRDYNRRHGITPTTITKSIREKHRMGVEKEEEYPVDARAISKEELRHFIADLRSKMDLAAKNLEFERAAVLRDRIRELRQSIEDSQKKRRSRKSG